MPFGSPHIVPYAHPAPIAVRECGVLRAWPGEADLRLQAAAGPRAEDEGGAVGLGDRLDDGQPEADALAVKMGHGPQTAPAQSAKIQAKLLKFAECMRTPGVPDYPDPHFGAGGQVTQSLSKGQAGNTNSPQIRAALKTCGQFQKIGKGSGGGPSLNSGGSGGGSGG